MAKFSDDFICFDKQPPVTDRRAVRAVLLPTYVWQVYGPDLKVKRANVFEKALLSQLSMGRGKGIDSLRVEELAKWHGLEPELVSFIINQQLIPKGWIDRKTGTLTKDGIEILSNDVSGASSLRTGYVFQDAIKGDFLPRYSNALDTIEPVSDSYTQPEFSMSKSSTRLWQPMILPDRVRPSEPNREALKNIMNSTHAAQRNARSMGSKENFESIYQMDVLRLSDKEPFAAFLWVWIYSAVGLEELWGASDPFGLHHDVLWMREMVRDLCLSVPKLSKEVASLIGGKTESEFSSLEAATAAREEQVKLEVLAEFGKADLVDGLVGLLNGWTSRKLDVETSESENRYHDYRDLITQSSGIIEHCLRYCLQKFPLKNLRIFPAKIEKSDVEKLLWVTSPFLTKLQMIEVIQVRPTGLYNTAKHKQGSFRLCMAVSLLSMPDYPNHPLRYFVKNESNFLAAYRLSHWRDSTAHADSNADVTHKKALEAATITTYFLNIFFEGLERG
ncbi:hypothetical protein [Shewanella xiamenensis]|uniref:hypothetical protein n=1 Tax=Shewanella xiamenensis TaxID=332186 RepID=UPI002177892A|nr:hypothetical protein [Shewanella xiamenensis]BDQ66159.1 hypothetical protein NUITMVS2_19710 [Shewanella xiamenensis]GLD79818.1 hypothetical protein NUITMVS3_42560 [Shewanella xiamenensis]